MSERNSPDSEPRGVHRSSDSEDDPVAVLSSSFDPSSFDVVSDESVSSDNLDLSGGNVREERIGIREVSSKEEGESGVGGGGLGEEKSSEMVSDISRGTEEEKLHLS